MRRFVIAIALLVGLGGADWAQLNESGKAAYSRGDYAEAERVFRQAAAAAPEEPELHYHRGVALTQLRRWSEAVAAYERALALQPPAGLAAAARAGLRSVEPMARPRAVPPPETEVATPPRPLRRPAALPSDAIRIRRQRGNWYVEVTLNELRQATFLVDTGASACAITPELAEAIGVSVPADAPSIRVQGVAGTTTARMATISSIQVGDILAENVMALVMPLPGMQGILGNTFLARYTATLDPGEGLLRLTPR